MRACLTGGTAQSQGNPVQRVRHSVIYLLFSNIRTRVKEYAHRGDADRLTPMDVRRQLITQNGSARTERGETSHRGAGG
jgi:hypothetical protein